MSNVLPTTPVPLPTPLGKRAKLRGVASRAWAGLLAAATSSAAVRQEKNLAITVISGTLLSIGASAGLVDLVTRIVQGL